MRNIVLLVYFFILVNLLQSCTGQNSDSISIWQSKYHNFKASYSSLWTLLPSYDTEEKTIFGVIDKKDGKSYIVKITKDVSKEELPDTDYYEYFKETMLKENPNNKFLGEQDIQFHGENYHGLEFLMHTEKWGILKQYAYIKRQGDFLTGIQVSYPILENDTNTEMPLSLKELDKNIKFGNN